MTTKSGKSVFLQAVTMINPAIGWIEIRTIPTARVDLVSNQVDLAWLVGHLLVYSGNEFIASLEK